MQNATDDANLYKQTVFVPEMGVHPVEGKEKTEPQAFEVDEKVKQFLEDEKLKVLLVQGGGGSGKSLFCHIFAKELLEDETEWIPLFINLPSLKDPINKVVHEYLNNNGFEEKEI